MRSADEHEPMAALAARHGLRPALARPRIGAYLRQVWHRRHFTLEYASSRNAARYTGSPIGRLWQVLTPLLNAAIYYVMFGVILGGRVGIEDYPAFLLTGMFVFTFTQRSIATSAKSISGNLSLIRALHFPRVSLPISCVIQELQQLCYSMGVLAVLLVLTGQFPTWHWLLLPVLLALQTMFNLGAGLVVARLGSSMRDINQLLPFVTRAWLYSSGVFFSIQDKAVGHPTAGNGWSGANLPQWVADLMYLNPAASFMEAAREILMTGYRDAPYAGPPWIWASCAGWAVLMLLFGLWYFWRAEASYGRG
ncbi:ABC transporter permease [Spongiactinospora sp. TRM90649]|uniref:ABC transporter permease n=1 Tax=Spongiactinospora sp. TRM90649 TaxID=3031114 RepID=UPI0023F9FA97|nr:ABC transporter permease [Spongiactinospora sp. TRM90649]MDF5756236.1 ABC transporter permease [Spongiactinospora sp. TRM90649]